MCAVQKYLEIVGHGEIIVGNEQSSLQFTRLLRESCRGIAIAGDA